VKRSFYGKALIYPPRYAAEQKKVVKNMAVKKAAAKKPAAKKAASEEEGSSEEKEISFAHGRCRCCWERQFREIYYIR